MGGGGGEEGEERGLREPSFALQRLLIVRFQVLACRERAGEALFDQVRKVLARNAEGQIVNYTRQRGETFCKSLAPLLGYAIARRAAGKAGAVAQTSR